MRHWLRRRDDDRGAATVEFALLLPVILLILFMIIEFGRGFNMQIAITQAAREGVRVLALGGTAGDTVARTTTAAMPVTGIAVATSGCPISPTLATPPARVTVTRTYDYITPIGAIAGMFGPGSLAVPSLTGVGEMRCAG